MSIKIFYKEKEWIEFSDKFILNMNSGDGLNPEFENIHKDFLYNYFLVFDFDTLESSRYKILGYVYENIKKRNNGEDNEEELTRLLKLEAENISIVLNMINDLNIAVSDKIPLIINVEKYREAFDGHFYSNRKGGKSIFIPGLWHDEAISILLQFVVQTEDDLKNARCLLSGGANGIVKLKSATNFLTLINKLISEGIILRDKEWLRNSVIDCFRKSDGSSIKSAERYINSTRIEKSYNTAFNKLKSLSGTDD